MEEWPSIPALVMRGNTPTFESALHVLQHLHVENGELAALGKPLLNKYIEVYNTVDVPYEVSEKRLPTNKKTGCKSIYHTAPCEKKAIWTRSICKNCELLQFNWERASWPRLSVLDRHLSADLCKILRTHFNIKLYHRLVAFTLGARMDLSVDQLALRYSNTEVSPRSLIPILGVEGACDVKDIRRTKNFKVLSQRIPSLLSVGYARVPANFMCRRGRVVGVILHHIGPFIYTATYKRVIDIALSEPFVLQLAAPFKSAESAEFLTHEQVLERLVARKPIFGSLKTCMSGNITALDSRGSIFIDLIHCAEFNSGAVLSPIDALHFSPDPDVQQLLEKERQRPWQVGRKPHPALALLIDLKRKEKRQK